MKPGPRGCLCRINHLQLKGLASSRAWDDNAAPQHGGYELTEAILNGARPDPDRVTIKKYANRRLYNTASSSYVTLDHLAEMVRKGTDFVVYDAKTNEDITRSVLTQIIFEEESRGQNLLPIQFLRQLIRFYGDSMQSLLPTYLEMSLDAFTRQQEQFRGQFSQAFGASGVGVGTGFFDEQVRQNLALFDRAMKMFSPFAYARPDEAPKPAPQPQAKQAERQDESLQELKRQVEEMRAQLQKLAEKQ
jgi:polyhydroxyalkanoate synthesis repressor PhaR